MDGRYSLRICKKESGEIKRSLEFDNLITDGGLNRIANGNWIDRVVIGTGTTAPENDDTALESLSLSTTTQENETTISAGSAPYKKRYLTTYRFAAAALTAGVEYSEIVVGGAIPACSADH